MPKSVLSSLFGDEALLLISILGVPFPFITRLGLLNKTEKGYFAWALVLAISKRLSLLKFPTRTSLKRGTVLVVNSLNSNFFV